MDIDPESVLWEISNIISGAYITALATLINQTIDLSPPQTNKDTINYFINFIASKTCLKIDTVLVIGAQLSIGNKNISGSYILMLEDESFGKLLSYYKDHSIHLNADNNKEI